MTLIVRLLGGGGAPIWWRRAKFASSTAASERKIKDRVARNVVREMSIGENYERNITPIGSDISRFSRRTSAHFVLRPPKSWLIQSIYPLDISQLTGAASAHSSLGRVVRFKS